MLLASPLSEKVRRIYVMVVVVAQPAQCPLSCALVMCAPYAWGVDMHSSIAHFSLIFRNNAVHHCLCLATLPACSCSPSILSTEARAVTKLFAAAFAVQSVS